MSDELKVVEEYKGETLKVEDGDTKMELISEPSNSPQISILLKDLTDGESACIVLDEKQTHMTISLLLGSNYGKTYTLPNLPNIPDDALMDLLERRKAEKLKKAEEELFKALNVAYNAGMTIEDIQYAASNF
ncbi:hypothetical protein BPS10C_189 [Bacillus phage BPS10C]|uniref:Uncharacterized protein n=1 Tax=Bacillus phage BPS10C TaxID=1277886 RepID=W5QUD3_9CAUD|nr:hypothetical protein BPS10C_189 [Bacillus phage BPS10C]AGI12186.1 hypothetical protein BPS10C_189 [Bacillus phage BPS10C]